MSSLSHTPAPGYHPVRPEEIASRLQQLTNAPFPENAYNTGRPAPAAVEAATQTPVQNDLPAAGRTMAQRDSQLTDRGYVDMKFHHNKLW